jgi:hypothetical protein
MREFDTTGLCNNTVYCWRDAAMHPKKIIAEVRLDTKRNIFNPTERVNRLRQKPAVRVSERKVAAKKTQKFNSYTIH